jgi:hypothetical protein
MRLNGGSAFGAIRTDRFHTPMLRFFLVHMGHRLVGQSGVARALDWKLGLRLLRDRRVPATTKLLSFGLGIGALIALEAFELPFETALALLVPVLGLAADFALDGIELLSVPFFVATLALPFLAPREVVDEVRSSMNPQPVSVTTPPSNRNGYDSGHVYDANATIR